MRTYVEICPGTGRNSMSLLGRVCWWRSNVSAGDLQPTERKVVRHADRKHAEIRVGVAVEADEPGVVLLARLARDEHAVRVVPDDEIMSWRPARHTTGHLPWCHRRRRPGPRSCIRR